MSKVLDSVIHLWFICGMLCVTLCCVLRYVVCCLLCTTRTSRYDAFQKNCELELRGSANNRVCCVWCVDSSGGTSNTLPLLLLFLCFVLLRYVLLVLLGMTRFKRTASSSWCMLDWPALCVQVISIKPPSPCCCKFLLRSGLRVCVFFSSRWQCEVWRGPVAAR